MQKISTERLTHSTSQTNKSVLALIEKADEGYLLGNSAKRAIVTLFIHYITKGRY